MNICHAQNLAAKEIKKSKLKEKLEHKELKISDINTEKKEKNNKIMRKFITFLVRKIPRPILIKFSFLFSKIVSVFYKGNNYQCPVCENKFRKLLPYGNKGIDNRLCPSCLSLERHRLLWVFLKEKTSFFTEELKLLHIAPEQPFLKRFKKLKNIDYITADLVSPIADVKLDIQNMPFGEEEFNVIFANHVLEHIPDENKAITEVYRVLKKDGWAIMQVPLDVNRKETYEDSSIKTEAEREKHFGQYDHLRLHGLDFSERLKKGGFKVEIIDLVNEIGKDKADFFRLDLTEKIYLCKKVSRDLSRKL